MGATDRRVLVTRATGMRGSSVVRALAGSRFLVRAMTRTPDSDAARALADLGAEVVAGDPADEASLRRAVAGSWGVFAAPGAGETGVEREAAQGERIATLARELGVEHFVCGSAGSAHRRTGVPYLEACWRIEQTVRTLRFPSHVIVRPVCFMDRLLSPSSLHGDALVGTLAPHTVLQMVAVEDLGRLVARAFTHAAEMNRHEVELAGDAMTMPEAAATLAAALGRPIAYRRIPLEDVRRHSVELAILLEWLDRGGFAADIPALRRKYALFPITLARWASGRLAAYSPSSSAIPVATHAV